MWISYQKRVWNISSERKEKSSPEALGNKGEKDYFSRKHTSVPNPRGAAFITAHTVSCSSILNLPRMEKKPGPLAGAIHNCGCLGYVRYSWLFSLLIFHLKLSHGNSNFLFLNQFSKFLFEPSVMLPITM